MIDEVRTTVLAVLNKNNYGYLSPLDFNLYAKQAQLEIFENLFYDYNRQLNLENVRKSGTDYADISKGVLQTIELFSVESSLVNIQGTAFYVLPDDYYLVNRVDFFLNAIYKGEAELVTSGKIRMLNSSPLTAPSEDFPAYIIEPSNTYGTLIEAFPNSFSGGLGGSVRVQYIRYPKDPKWTYRMLGSDNNPVYVSTTDTQDFELPKDYFNDIVLKILKYAGLEIREKMVIDFANSEEQQDNIEQQ